MNFRPIYLSVLSLIATTPAFADNAQCIGDQIAKEQGVTSPFAAIEKTLEPVLKKAAFDIYKFKTQSPNFKKISSYLLMAQAPIQRTLDSEPIAGYGKFRIVNDLKTGEATLFFDQEGAKARRIFSLAALPPSERMARLQSVTLEPETGEALIWLRSYRRNTPYFIEKRVKLPAPLPEGFVKKIILRNFRVEEAVSNPPYGNIEVRNFGLNASTDVVLFPPDGSKKMMLTTFDEFKNNRVQFNFISVSPNKKFAVLRTYQDGSLDKFTLHVYSFEKGEMVQTLTASNPDPTWTGDATLSYYKYLEGPGSEKMTQDFSRDFSRDFSKEAPDSAATTALSSDNVIGSIGDQMFMTQSAPSGEIVGISTVSREDFEKGNASAQRWIYQTNGQTFIDNGLIRGDYLLVGNHFGADKSYLIFDAQGKSVGEYKVPTCCSLKMLDWTTPGKVLKLGFNSAVRGDIEANYDLETAKYSDPEVLNQVMSRDGEEFVSEIVKVQSKDGTMIPVRLTHLKTFAKDGSHPAFMTVYGGFGIQNDSFSPAYNAIRYQFMRDGGVLVSPAVRGGNEYGVLWHLNGANLRKTNTYDDVVAVAHYLADQKISQPRKIILSGTSNGGLSTSASGLTDPDAFGLLIPINGVHDMYLAEVLDPKFEGWDTEYGHNAIPAENANKLSLSPIERLANPPPHLPEFLIINGANDSRVNPLHSHFLQTRLEGVSPGKSNLLVMPFAGHWEESPSYQKSISWYVETIIWAKIYDFLGMKFTAKPGR